MTSKLKTWLCGTALAASLISAACLAMGPGEGMERDPAQMMAHMSKRLDLSSEQQAKVESLLTTSQQASAADQKRLQELREEMMGMRATFDAASGHKIADEIGQITGRRVFQVSETWSKVYQLLTPEQRTQMDAMMAKRGERRGKPGGEKDTPSD